MNLVNETQEKATKSSDDYKKFPNLTVFISNLSYECDEEKIKTVFEKVYFNSLEFFIPI